MDMEKLYKQYADLFNKSDLYEYLNIYSFVDLAEIYLAVCDFLDAKMEGIDWQWCSDAQEFAKDYYFDVYADVYDEQIENYADFYAEAF